MIVSISGDIFNVLYLSEEGSTADGGSLLWCQGHPAPAAPTGQSAALWVCRSGKPQLSREQFHPNTLLDLSVDH